MDGPKAESDDKSIPALLHQTFRCYLTFCGHEVVGAAFASISETIRSSITISQTERRNINKNRKSRVKTKCGRRPKDRSEAEERSGSTSV